MTDLIDSSVCPICQTGRTVRDVFDRQALHIAALNHEAENQANRIHELEDKLAAAHKAMAAGEALARAVMLDQTGEG